MKKSGRLFRWLIIAGLAMPAAAYAVNAGLEIGSDAKVAVDSGTLLVNDDITILSDGSLGGQQGNIEVGGNWTNDGTFTPTSTTVSFIDGASLVNISGINHFYNLEAKTTTGKQINFAAGEYSANQYYQTVSNSLHFEGATGNLLILRSTSGGAQAKLGTYSGISQFVKWVDVQDHYAWREHIADGAAYAGFSSIDNGNNTGWFNNPNADDPYTLVELVSFTATPYDDYILLEWETVSEVENAGFNIWRGENGENYEQLNDDLIPAEGSAISGVRYRYEDHDAIQEYAYNYILEDVDIHGIVTQHDLGPVSLKSIDGGSGPGETVSGSTGAGSNSGFCFIATAAYGSYLHPDVKVLRDFRDNWLLTNVIGTKLVNLYYTLSPSLAKIISGNEACRTVTRWALTPVVYGVKYPAMLLVLLLFPAALFAAGTKRLANLNKSR